MTPEDVEQEMTDAEKATTPDIRIRVRPDPVLTHKCAHCENPFWFKRSHGRRTHNGRYASWRVECGWCAKPNYLPVNEHNEIVDEFVESTPHPDELRYDRG